MKFIIQYKSNTGNTKLISEAVHYAWREHECLYFGPLNPTVKMEDCEVVGIGFWTDKGACDEDMKAYLQQLHHKKIFLFGTAGFGSSDAYFSAVVNRVQAWIPEDNEMIKTFMCQGKMPIRVRRRYEEMYKDNPKKFQPLIDNFDQALSHPNVEDINHAEEAARSFLACCEQEKILS